MAELPWPAVAAVAVGLAILCGWASPAGRLRSATGVDRRARRHDQRLRHSALIAVSALALAVGLGWWALPAAVALGAVSYALLGRFEAGSVVRRREQLAAELPQACDLLAVCLQSGQPLRVAASEVARVLDQPLGPALADVSMRVALGADEAGAWTELAEAEPALATLGREVARSVGSGIALAAALRVLGADARRQAVALAQVRARRVGVRSVLPLMTCFLPSFLLLGVVPIIGGVLGRLFG